MAPGYGSFTPVTPEDLNLAGYFNYYVRGMVTRQCIKDQDTCLNIKRYADGFDRNNKGNERQQKQFVKTGCDKLLKSSCAIEPKGDRFNAFGATCTQAYGRAHDCSIISDPTPSCKGESGYRLPGCAGYRQTNVEEFIKSCNHRADKNEEKWKNYWRDRGTLQSLTTGEGPEPRCHYGGCEMPPNTKMCIRLAFDDPKVLMLMEDELNSES